MYYTSGNYEAFATPRKPKDVDQKSAYIVGTGLAGLAAAVFLIRDGHMAGERIHLFEELPLAGGSLDGIEKPHLGFVTGVVVRWKTILSVCGICIGLFPHWKFLVLPT